MKLLALENHFLYNITKHRVFITLSADNLFMIGLTI